MTAPATAEALLRELADGRVHDVPVRAAGVGLLVSTGRAELVPARTLEQAHERRRRGTCGVRIMGRRAGASRP